MTVLRGSRYANSNTLHIRLQNRVRSTSRVLPFVITPSASDQVYVTKQGDNYWKIAGKRTIYGDPSLYWAIACSNPDPRFFQLMYDGFEAGEMLRIPPIETISELTNGRHNSNSIR